MYQRILVALDGSRLSEAALPQAEGLAQALKAELRLVRAVVPATAALAAGQPMDGPVPVDLIEEAAESETVDAHSYLAAQEQRLRDGGLSVTAEVVEADPAEAIVGRAREHNSDLIVMATHGRSGLSRLVLGSVAGEVVRNSHLPVLLVRPTP